MLITAALGLAAAGVAPVHGRTEDAQPEGPVRTSRIAHIHLTGDLDAISCVDRLRDQLDEAREDGATLLLLEIDADRTRPDVLLALAEAVRQAEIPTIGFLIDERDRRVTAPALALALVVGDRVAIDPRTAVRFERGDWREDLLPDDVVPAQAIEELRMAVQRALADREIDPTVANAWLPALDAAPADEIAPQSLYAVGVDTVIAQTPARVCRVAGHRGQVPRAIEIQTSLAPAQRGVERLLLCADDALEQSRRMLDLRNQRPDQREVTVHDHRRAGDEALDRLAQAAACIDQAEQVLRAYPEILLSAPPGRTDVGATRQNLRTAWRYRLDELRDDIDYWRERATSSASR